MRDRLACMYLEHSVCIWNTSPLDLTAVMPLILGFDAEAHRKVYRLRFSNTSIYLFVSTPMPCASFPGPEAQLDSAPVDELFANLLDDLLAT